MRHISESGSGSSESAEASSAGRKPVPPATEVAASARANTTDPDSRLVRGADGFLQGYNAQAVATEQQVIVAAELSTDSPDARLLEPMAQAVSSELEAAGLEAKPGTLVATEGSTRRRRGGPRKPRDKRPEGRYRRMARVFVEPSSDLHAAGDERHPGRHAGSVDPRGPDQAADRGGGRSASMTSRLGLLGAPMHT